MTTLTAAEQDVAAERRTQAIQTLQRRLPVGSTVYTTVLHISRSGMMRVIKVLVAHEGQIVDLSSLAADAIGARYDRARGGVIMSGCGMDMGFAVVYDLSRVLFADGFGCTNEQDGPQRCTSNDHMNERGDDVDYTPGRTHSDPGYALHQQRL